MKISEINMNAEKSHKLEKIYGEIIWEYNHRIIKYYNLFMILYNDYISIYNSFNFL